MKLLLDECVTRLVKRDLVGHDVHSVEEAGLKGLENSDLLRAASGTYEVLITVDQKIPYTATGETNPTRKCLESQTVLPWRVREELNG